MYNALLETCYCLKLQFNDLLCLQCVFCHNRKKYSLFGSSCTFLPWNHNFHALTLGKHYLDFQVQAGINHCNKNKMLQFLISIHMDFILLNISNISCKLCLTLFGSLPQLHSFREGGGGVWILNIGWSSLRALTVL